MSNENTIKELFTVFAAMRNDLWNKSHPFQYCLFRILKQFRNQNSTNSTCVPARYVAFFSFFSFFFSF